VNRKAKFIGGGLVIVAGLAYLIYAGVSQSVVYFVTPSELARPVAGKSYASAAWSCRHAQVGRQEPRPALHALRRQASVPVRHRGTPPISSGSRGAVVEGT